MVWFYFSLKEKQERFLLFVLLINSKTESLTFEWDLSVLVQVLLQFAVVHILAGGERGGYGRINPAEVEPDSGGRVAPCSPTSSSAQGKYSSPKPSTVHVEADMFSQSSPAVSVWVLGLCQLRS